MRITRRLIISLVVVVFVAIAANRGSADELGIASYFWPTEKGLVLRYESVAGKAKEEPSSLIVHTAEIVAVDRSRAGDIKVHTDETFEGLGLKYELPFEYSVSVSDKTILRRRRDQEEKPILSDILLKGPLEIGTAWSSSYQRVEVSTDPKALKHSEQSIPIKVTCHIADKSSNTPTGEKRTCLRVECPVPISDNPESKKPLVSTDHFFYCEGIGYFGNLVSGAGGEEFWMERLVSIEKKTKSGTIKR